MKRGVEARLCWSSRRLYRRPSSFVRVFEVVDVVQNSEENAGDDARDDRRRGRESDAFCVLVVFCDTEEDERTLGTYSTSFLSLFFARVRDDDAFSL